MPLQFIGLNTTKQLLLPQFYPELYKRLDRSLWNASAQSPSFSFVFEFVRICGHESHILSENYVGPKFLKDFFIYKKV